VGMASASRNFRRTTRIMGRLRGSCRQSYRKRNRKAETLRAQPYPLLHAEACHALSVISRRSYVATLDSCVGASQYRRNMAARRDERWPGGIWGNFPQTPIL
jgi:hypothetical protein